MEGENEVLLTQISESPFKNRTKHKTILAAQKMLHSSSEFMNTVIAI